MGKCSICNKESQTISISKNQPKVCVECMSKAFDEALNAAASKRLTAKIRVKDNHGCISNSPTQIIEFDDVCPICGADGLKVKTKQYHVDGEDYCSDNIICFNECHFLYDDLVNLTGFKRD